MDYYHQYGCETGGFYRLLMGYLSTYLKGKKEYFGVYGKYPSGL
ncbi:hypothetical protein [Aquiflexum gelatinilyticum]|nr:hypothetical protein [Aquiflexum gelatinilyticum]